MSFPARRSWQEACPWNAGATSEEGREWLAPHLPTLLALDRDGFRARFRRTAVTRARRRGLLRNVAVSLGNSGNPEAVPALARALETAMAAEADAIVLAELRTARGELP